MSSLSAPTQLKALQTLLRKQGLGSALPSVSTKKYPPATTGFAELDDLLGGGIPRGQITELVGKASSGWHERSAVATGGSDSTPGNSGPT